MFRNINLEIIFPSFIVFCIFSGGLVSYVIGKSLLYGVILGGLVGFSPLLFLGIVYLFMQMWSPERPDCVCGQCKSSDYNYIDSKSNIKERTYFYQCPNCDREYQRRGNRFEFTAPEGKQPYMKMSKWGRWIKDSREEQ